MKYLIIILLLFFSRIAISQPDAATLVDDLKQKMQLVENYRADILIRIDVDFIKIKKRRGVVYYEKPGIYDVKFKGLVLMPKKGSQMEYLDLVNMDHTALFAGEDTVRGNEVYKVKIIPNDPESEIILANLWIGKEDKLMYRMESYDKASGSYVLDIFYAGHPLFLPDKIRVTFDIKEYKIPASMTGDISEMAEGIKKGDITKGVVWLEYSNYIVNYK